MTLEFLLGVVITGMAGLLLLRFDAQREAGDPRPFPPPLEPSVIAPAEALTRAFEAVAARVKPAVVGIYWEGATRFRQRRSPLPFDGMLSGQFRTPQQRLAVLQQKPLSPPNRTPEFGMGSGIIIDKEGRILTNYQLVCGADDLLVTLADHRTFAAEFIGGDPKADVAVIQIKGKIPADLPVAELGDSDNLKVGEIVIAVGAIFGHAQIVTSGIISATGRSPSGAGGYEDFLQTDAAINPGNSGGPLVNLRGQVVGLNTATVAPENWFSGEGFAVPINLVRAILPVVIKGGIMPRQKPGVIIRKFNQNAASRFPLTSREGPVVFQVSGSSPAREAGIKVGDITVHYDGTPVKNTRQLRDLVVATLPDAMVEIESVRDGGKRTFQARVGKSAVATMAAFPPETPAVFSTEPVAFMISRGRY